MKRGLLQTQGSDLGRLLGQSRIVCYLSIMRAINKPAAMGMGHGTPEKSCPRSERMENVKSPKHGIDQTVARRIKRQRLRAKRKALKARRQRRAAKKAQMGCGIETAQPAVP